MIKKHKKKNAEEMKKTADLANCVFVVRIFI